MCNDLSHAVRHASPKQLTRLGDYVQFALTQAPAACHGSCAAVARWIAHGGAEGGLSAARPEVTLSPGLIERFKLAVGEFWDRVARNDPPAPNFALDGELLRQLMPQDNGAEIDLTGDNELASALVERARLKAIAKDADTVLESLDALIRFKVGMAQVARCGSFRISLKSYERAAYTVEAATLRPLRVSEPKAAKFPNTQKAA